MDEAVVAEPTAGDETVDVRMVSELLVPGVEHGEDAWDEPTSGRRLEDRLGDGGEECVQRVTALRADEEAA